MSFSLAKKIKIIMKNKSDHNNCWKGDRSTGINPSGNENDVSTLKKFVATLGHGLIIKNLFVFFSLAI